MSIHAKALIFVLVQVLWNNGHFCIANDGFQIKTGSCQPITNVTMCHHLDLWNNTYLPNVREQESQGEVHNELDDFILLIQSECSNAIVHFLCSVYLPHCTNIDQQKIIVISPCRQVCEYVRQDCEPLLIQNKFEWPLHLGCDNFPTVQPCFNITDLPNVRIPSKLLPPQPQSQQPEPSTNSASTATIDSTTITMSSLVQPSVPSTTSTTAQHIISTTSTDIVSTTLPTFSSSNSINSLLSGHSSSSTTVTNNTGLFTVHTSTIATQHHSTSSIISSSLQHTTSSSPHLDDVYITSSTDHIHYPSQHTIIVTSSNPIVMPSSTDRPLSMRRSTTTVASITRSLSPIDPWPPYNPPSYSSNLYSADYDEIYLSSQILTDDRSLVTSTSNRYTIHTSSSTRDDGSRFTSATPRESSSNDNSSSSQSSVVQSIVTIIMSCVFVLIVYFILL